MKPKVLHQEAMEYSFKAKKALEEENSVAAFEYYKKAAELEGQVAEFYFDKPELEPTRSILIRSAAFINIKAGLIDSAKKFIFFGLLNISDEAVKNQLENALQIIMGYGQNNSEEAMRELNYINLLRQRSVHYSIEPRAPFYGKSVSLEMIKKFADEYLKSLKAYSIAEIKKLRDYKESIEKTFSNRIGEFINPLITNSAYGSFKFSIANDFVKREGESQEFVHFKTNIILKYHNEIFTNPLDEGQIQQIKKGFTEEEVNEIFKPLIRIKSNNSAFEVAYYDNETFQKKYSKKILNKQKKQLLNVNKVSPEDIGELESSIVHKRSSNTGRVSTKTIFKEQLKSYEIDIEINEISPKDAPSVILADSILVNMSFDSNKGFILSFDDFRIEATDIEYEKALNQFHNFFYEKLKYLARQDELTESEQRDWDSIKHLIGDSEAIQV